jgi:lysozyme
MQKIYLEAIKSFEGFSPVAKPDYSQLSNGFGTKALYPGEQIDRAEAERRFSHEIARARDFVEKHVPNLDEGTKAALTSLTYNAGTRWASSGLGEAARQGDLASVRESFLQYTKAGGKELPGLVTRRNAEAMWIGSGIEAATQAAGSPSRSPQLRPVPIVLADAASQHISVGSDTPLRASASLQQVEGVADTSTSRERLPLALSPAAKFGWALAAFELALPRRSEERRKADGVSTRHV